VLQCGIVHCCVNEHQQVVFYISLHSDEKDASLRSV
jgi:hypothetical protein